MTMKAVIFRRGKTAMQSGRAGSSDWILESERTGATDAVRLDPVTGWPGGTPPHLRLVFPNLAEAEAYARSRDLPYTVRHPLPERGPIIKSYADNFSNRRARPWTH